MIVVNVRILALSLSFFGIVALLIVNRFWGTESLFVYLIVLFIAVFVFAWIRVWYSRLQTNWARKQTLRRSITITDASGLTTVIAAVGTNSPVQPSSVPAEPESTGIKTSFPGMSVSAVYAADRAHDVEMALRVLLVALAGFFLLSLFWGGVPGIIFLILAGAVVFVGLDWWVLTYRIRHGYFATNRREALELIRFVKEESENIDFTDGGAPKQILTDEDLEELQGEIKSLLPSPVGGAL